MRVPYFVPEIERHCVFARYAVPNNVDIIEYCAYQEFIDSDIRSSPNCTRVASLQGEVRRVLSTRYTEWDYQGGESEGEYTCTVPKATQDDVRRAVGKIIKNLIGTSSKYFASVDSDVINYKAEGINIENKSEKMFVRAYLFGSYEEPTRGKSGVSVKFTVNVNMTVSAQASENIMDYREPSEAMADRMRNQFNDFLRTSIRSEWPGAGCKLE